MLHNSQYLNKIDLSGPSWCLNENTPCLSVLIYDSIFDWLQYTHDYLMLRQTGIRSLSIWVYSISVIPPTGVCGLKSV